MLEDLDSTNGSWMRLSKEQSKSPPFILKEETIFKIGNSAMYQVMLPEKEIDNQSGQANERAERNNKDHKKCYICFSNERNCLFLPCKHNFSCMKCSKNLEKCPIDRGVITEFIKIYNV